MSAGAPAAPPLLGHLVGGFALLAAGIAWLGRRRGVPSALASAAGTRRALLCILAYTVCAWSLLRVLGPALLAADASPWLLALGDVIFVTLALFVWAVFLAEGRPWSAYGLHGGAVLRLLSTTALGVAAALIHSGRAYTHLLAGGFEVSSDALVFAALFAVAGSAMPEELLFRGYLQGTLAGRVRPWARVVTPALAFALWRAVRFTPGPDLPTEKWLFDVLGVALPLGLWWGLMRDLAGGSLWPCLVAHVTLEFGPVLSDLSRGNPVPP